MSGCICEIVHKNIAALDTFLDFLDQESQSTLCTKKQFSFLVDSYSACRVTYHMQPILEELLLGFYTFYGCDSEDR